MTLRRGCDDILAAALGGAHQVALGDGVGAPVGLFGPLTEAARRTGTLSLLLGWCVAWSDDLDPAAFRDVSAFMGGYGVRSGIAAGRVRYLPLRLGALPAMVRGPLRPDVLVASVRPADGGFCFGTEVGWMQAVVEAGVPVVAEVNHGLPAASAAPAIPPGQVTVACEVDRPPVSVRGRPPSPEWMAIGSAVARLVPERASLQVGPGSVGDAVLAAVSVPVRLDSGVVGDAAVALFERGLVDGPPSAGYLCGTERLYRWADGRRILRGLEHTHNVTRLAGRPLVAVNTALEIDGCGQVNVEGFGGDVVGGVGGHGDFALAATRSGGLSVVAMPRRWHGRPTLVDRLSAPVSTARSDVDVVVTEAGAVDLRRLSDPERAEALRDLWDRPDPPTTEA